MKKRKPLLIALAVIVVAAVASYFVFRPQPTKVALYNYPSFMVGRMISSANEKNVSVKVEKDLKRLSRYDAVLLWGMGGNAKEWTDEDREFIQSLGEKKIVYAILAATNPQNNLTNISDEEKETLSNYVFNGGVKNYRSLFNYIRRDLLGKPLREGTVEDPVVFSDNVFYGKTDEDIFDSYEAYQKYYQTHGYVEGAPKVAFLLGFATPNISNRDHVDSVVASFEAKGMNVYPFSSGADRIAVLKEINPDLIVYVPHGRLIGGGPNSGAESLRELNVPILTAMTLTTSREEWLKDKQGMVGGFLAQSVSSPEFDGVMVPYALFSMELNSKTGVEEFQAMPDRLKTFTDLAYNYIKLKKTPNKDKKVALFYYKGPGENSLVAQGIEVLPSLYNLLRKMQEEGYNLTGLPTSEKEFEKVISTRGRLFNSYADGALQRFIEEGYPAFIPAARLKDMMAEVLTEEQISTLKEKYGEAPGSYYSYRKGNEEGIVVTRVQFGNVVLLPQPGQGVGENDFKAVHGANPIPPYPYIAAYLWAQKEFKADVLTHFGTHGSLEFINGKQVALSANDWTDRLVNDIPHVYYYTIANIGEGMIAKRRSYAETVSYLAPPFIETELKGEVANFLSLTDKYLSNEKDDVALAKKIKEEAIKAGYHRDLGIDSTLTTPLSRFDIEELSNFAEELAISKIPGGLYVTGVPFTDKKIRSSVMMLSIDPIVYGLADLDIQRGTATIAQQKSERFMTKRYRVKSEALVKKIINGGDIQPDAALLSLGVSASELHRADAFFAMQSKMEDMPTSMGGRPQGMSKGKTSMGGHPQGMPKGKASMGGHPQGMPKGKASMGGHPQGMPKGKASMGGHPQGMPKGTTQMAGVPKEQLRQKAGGHPGMGGGMQDEMEFDPKEQHLAVTIANLRAAVANIKNYYKYLQASPQLELDSWINALNGGFVAPSPGGDYIANPQTLPTGRNLFSINAEATPSDAAWKKGVEMGDALMEDYKRRNGDLPQKVSFTLWSSSFIESEGATIAEIIYLLGCEPVRDPMGRVQDVRLVPRDELGRKRIDVIVQTSGQFRDLAASRLYLIQKAVDLARNSKEEDNEVVKGAEAAEKVLLEKGLTPSEARNFSTQRVFGGVNGNYGTGIQEMVEAGDRWDDEKEIANVYLNNMGAVYGDPDNWGSFTEGLFEAALQRTDVVVQPRQSNSWGPLSLDHVYEFMGGLSLTVRNVTGKDPEAYFNDLRNHYKAKTTELKRSIGNEARTTILNPTYVKEMLKAGEGAANALAETVRNTYGWNVMKPAAIDKELWDGIYDTYIADVHHLGVQEFFDRENPAALQELTAVMMETIRKGMWKASDKQIQDITNLHVASVLEHGAGCSGFVCDNAKLRQFIDSKAKPEEQREYQKAISDVREVKTTSDSKAQILKKDSDKQESSSVEKDKSSTYVITYVVIGILVLVVVVALIRRSVQKRKNKTASK